MHIIDSTSVLMSDDYKFIADLHLPCKALCNVVPYSLHQCDIPGWRFADYHPDLNAQFGRTILVGEPRQIDRLLRD